MKLYKYRPLASCKNVERVEELIDGKLYFSTFDRMNDPMEGILRAHPDKIEEIYNEKRKIGIFSFSKSNAIELMRAHYANGFKWCVIEFDTEDMKTDIKKYDMDYRKWGDLLESTTDVYEILSRKKYDRSYEQEYRLFTNLDPNEKGKEIWKHIHWLKVTAVYFWNPFGWSYNRRDIFSSNDNLKKYDRYKRIVLGYCEEINNECERNSNCKGKINCYNMVRNPEDNNITFKLIE